PAAYAGLLPAPAERAPARQAVLPLRSLASRGRPAAQGHHQHALPGAARGSGRDRPGLDRGIPVVAVVVGPRCLRGPDRRRLPAPGTRSAVGGPTADPRGPGHHAHVVGVGFPHEPAQPGIRLPHRPGGPLLTMFRPTEGAAFLLRPGRAGWTNCAATRRSGASTANGSRSVTRPRGGSRTPCTSSWVCSRYRSVRSGRSTSGRRPV